MDKSVASKNIVFVGVFQPSKLDKLFFVKNNIFNENEILQSSIFNQDIAQVQTKDVNIVILINQIIITQIEIRKDDIHSIAYAIIKLVSEEITALGINFMWHYGLQENLEDITKRYFYNSNNKMYNGYFDSPDALYGSYLSKNIENGRLKLEIKPQLAKSKDINVEPIRFISFGFNFHFEIDNIGSKELLNYAISNYFDLFNESEKIMFYYE